MSNRPVLESPMRPLKEDAAGVLAAVKLTPALLPVTITLAVVAVRLDPEVSMMAPVVAVRLTAELVVLAVVMAVEARLMLPAEAARVIVPASVLRLVTFKCPVEAVKLKFSPVV